tara:strand:- start:3880 stop:4035 length:156 start_codon:yes stop_codon:yes gene_type:complete
MVEWDRKVERRVGFLRRKKAKQSSKNKRLNRQKKDESKYKDVLNLEEEDEH